MTSAFPVYCKVKETVEFKRKRETEFWGWHQNTFGIILICSYDTGTLRTVRQQKLANTKNSHVVRELDSPNE